MQRLMIVEDDLDIQELLQNFLQEAGYDITLANDGVEAITLFSQKQFDLILLDIMLPKIDGFSVCELIRKQSQVPIIMLTALSGEEEQIRGLDLQVDDYITKPFSMPVLIRKIATVLRRSTMLPGQEHQTISYKNLILDLDSYTALINGNSYELTQREFEVLHELLLNQGRVLTRQNLLDRLWKYDFYGDERVVDTHIKNLRKNLVLTLSKQSEGWDIKLIKKSKSSLFTKIFIVTFLLTCLCCMITYGVISWLIPKTYSTTLDASLDNAVHSLLTEVENLTPIESGNLFDEFMMNQNGVLVQLFDSSNREIELPSQNSTTFPIFITSGIAIETDDPAAYRAAHNYIFTFADTTDSYTFAVAGSAQEINLLKDTLGSIFLILIFVILLVAVLASIVYSHYVTRPVLRISNVSKRMAELDFNWKCDEKTNR